MATTSRAPAPTNGGGTVRKIRIALYSHDTMGIGHMRRNSLIAQAFNNTGRVASILLIAGAREAAAFPMPDGVDCLTLPSFRKDDAGGYHSRSLGVDLADLCALRAQSIKAALEAFQPDVLIVDKVPRGALRELDPALEMLKAGGRTRCVLGLRDILDDPAIVAKEWAAMDNDKAIHDYYHQIWIYGDPVIFDLMSEYDFAPHVAAKARYVGILARPAVGAWIDESECVASLVGSDEKMVLCLVGGGQDGAQLAEAFGQVDFPTSTKGVIVTGPFMQADAQQRLCQRAAVSSQLQVVRFVTDLHELMARSSWVIAMGGYNSTYEIVSSGKPALIVPRVKPRSEQLIRAMRLHDLGLIDLLHPAELTPGSLTGWLGAKQNGADKPCRPIGKRINLNGLANLPRLLEEVIDTPSEPVRKRVLSPLLKETVPFFG